MNKATTMRTIPNGAHEIAGEVKSLTDGRVQEGAQRDSDGHGNQRQHHEQAYTETQRHR
jgi:hypothetical protein